MGKPITNIKRMDIPEENKVEEDVQEVKEAVSANKESILKGIELLSALDEADALQAATAITKHRKEALGNLVKELNKPQYSKSVENIPELLFLFGEIDLDEVRKATERLNNGLHELQESSEEEKTSYFDLVKALKDPEINRSITLLMKFLKGMGKT
ncbi:DUF1641 domain-containing protein [Thalassobacillus sp. CUG 92003]|uniref:DUF1641 domain-containing protein n=1 Tax=Thalassobacillus sp. CUG 92003 TaxID=2736641 RepID=UPI0015E7B8E4|nr:DUF1641 domain-containing protein [Thalassobacillus sp. CUG 92003]